MKKVKNNTVFIIFVITILILTISTSIALWAINKLEPEEEIKEPQKCNISISYTTSSNLELKTKITLTEDEENKLNNILNNLEFSSPTEGITEEKFTIEYCEEKIIIGDNNKITKNNENVNITKGYEELSSFISSKESELNKVYFYHSSDSYLNNYKEIDISEEDKNSIREIWQNQDKELYYLDLAILNADILIIDDEVLYIDDVTEYVQYKDGFIVFDKEIIDILNKYDDSAFSSSEYTINNNMSYYNSKYQERGVYYDTLNRPNAPSYYTIASGEKGSGGYSISITKVNIDENGNVEVIVSEESPGLYEVTTSVMTYPICQIEFKTLPKSIIFKTEQGEILPHINF